MSEQVAHVHDQHDAIPQLDSLFSQTRERCYDAATGWEATHTVHENGGTTLTIETWPIAQAVDAQPVVAEAATAEGEVEEPTDVVLAEEQSATDAT